MCAAKSMERPTDMMRMFEVMADRVRPQKNIKPTTFLQYKIS
jgi:hypothetical protein